MVRFGDEHGCRSIRSSPLYKPYHRCITLCAGRAGFPRGELKDLSIIRRGALFDALNDSEKYWQILGSYALPHMSGQRPRMKNRTPKDRGVMTVVGVVMSDLGYHPYSKHAWSREPMEG